MSDRLAFLLVTGAAIAWAVVRSRGELMPYRARGCRGVAWRGAFPTASSDDIRVYLRCFVDGMAIRSRYMLKFDPSDRVLDVYRCLYGGRTPIGDHMECETFLEEVAHELDVGMDGLMGAWHPEITLGELFASAMNSAR